MVGAQHQMLRCGDEHALGLRVRARCHAKGEQQGKRQAQKTQFHDVLQTPNSTVEFPSQGALMLFGLCFLNKSPGPENLLEPLRRLQFRGRDDE